MPKCIVGMLNAELSQARRWCQKLTLSSRLFFSNTVFSETSLATFSVIVKDPGKKICKPKIYSYPSQVAVMPAAVVLVLLFFCFLRELDMFYIACLVFGLLNEAIRVNPGK